MEQKKSANELLAENLAEFVGSDGNEKARQMAFAKRVGVSQRTVGNCLNPKNRKGDSATGKQPSATVRVVETIALALNMQAYELLMPHSVRDQFKAYQAFVRQITPPAPPPERPAAPSGKRPPKAA